MILLTLLALTGCVERPEWRPHAEMMNDPELTRLPDRQLPPPAPLRAPTDRPDVTVYGYWPYWGDGLDTLYWDQLTHVAIFSVELQSNGSFANTSRWHNVAAQAMQLAAPYGVRVHLCFTSFSDTITNAVLGSAALRTTAVNNLASLVNQYGAHGVNIDIEGMDSTHFTNLVLFVQELDRAVGDVTLATPAVDWSNAYDYDRLADESDGLFIMGYDYHWRTSPTAGPVDPLYGGGPWSQISLHATVDDYLGSADPDRVILGLPLYGYRWPTASDAIAASATGSASTVLYEDFPALMATHGRRWDSTTRSPWVWDGSGQAWAPDEDSVHERVSYALDRGLSGVGFWALHYDGDDPALWSRLRPLTTTGAVDEPDPPAGDSAAPVGPIANAGLPFRAYVGETVELSGEGSWGPGDLTFRWTQTGGPSVTLDHPRGPSPRFEAAEPGLHRFELVVTAGGVESEPDEALVVVTDPQVGRRYRGCDMTGGGLGIGLLLLRRRRSTG